MNHLCPSDSTKDISGVMNAPLEADVQFKMYSKHDLQNAVRNSSWSSRNGSKGHNALSKTTVLAWGRTEKGESSATIRAINKLCRGSSKLWENILHGNWMYVVDTGRPYSFLPEARSCQGTHPLNGPVGFFLYGRHGNNGIENLVLLHWILNVTID